MSSRKTPSARDRRANPRSRSTDRANAFKNQMPYAVGPQPQLSLVAYFDDMVRLRDTLFEELHMLHNKLKLSVAQMESNRVKWQRAEKALENERMEKQRLEEDLARTNLTLKGVREAYRREVMLKETIKKERDDFLDKLQTVRDYLGGDRNLDRAQILNNLNSMNMLPEMDRPGEDSASDDSLSIAFDDTEDDILMEKRRSSVASKRRSAPKHYGYVTAPHSPNKRPPLAYESNAPQFNTRETGISRLYPSVHFESPAIPEIQNPKQNIPPNPYETRSRHALDGAIGGSKREEEEPRESERESDRETDRETEIGSTASTTSLRHRFAAQNHVLALKKFFKSETCNGCSRKITFCVNGYRCSVCHSSCHTECRDKLPKCIPYVPPNAKHGNRLSIAAFVQANMKPAIPPLIYHLVEEIESRNLEGQGLYRVGAADREVEMLTEKLIHAKHGLPSLKEYDVHLLANVMKRFFRDLDEPLLTRVLWRDFVNAAEKRTREDRKNLLIQAIAELPPPNRDTLVYLVEHFHRVIQVTGKMDIQSIARAFAPILVGHSMVNPPVEQILAENPKQINVLESILRLPNDVWARFNDDDQMSRMKQSTSTSMGTRILGGNCSSGFLTPYKKVQTGSKSGQNTQSGLTLKPLF